MPQLDMTILGDYILEIQIMNKMSNRMLADAAGVSEGAIRNLQKVGRDDDAKDPDPRTLRLVAEALNISPLKLFSLAGYLPPEPTANSIRAQYLADVFDRLPPTKQNVVMSMLEALTESPEEKVVIQEMQQSAHDDKKELEESVPVMIRETANLLIAQYMMTEPADVHRIEADFQLGRKKWRDLSLELREHITTLIREKLSLGYEPKKE